MSEPTETPDSDAKFVPSKDRPPTWHTTNSGLPVGVLHGECKYLGYIAEPAWGCNKCGANGWTKDVVGEVASFLRAGGDGGS